MRYGWKAEYLHPGFMFPEESMSKELECRDDQDHAIEVAVSQAPKSAFCLTVRRYPILENQDMMCFTRELGAVAEQFKLVSKKGSIKESPRAYLGGQVFTVDQLRNGDAGHEDVDILVSNIEQYADKLAIRCPPGNWQPFRPSEGETVQEVG